MAKDGMTMHLRGGAKLERILGSFQQRIGTRIVGSSLNQGATLVKKSVASETPVYKSDSVVSSKNRSPLKVTAGQLKRSIKSGLRNKTNVGRNTFLAGVWFQNKKGGASADSDGWYAKQVLESHKANAFGYTGGNNFLKKGVDKARKPFISKVGGSIGKKVKNELQKEINTLK